VTSAMNIQLNGVFDEVTSWFFDDYFPRWVSVGNGTNAVIADSRVTVFHANGAAIDAIWSRRATDDTEIQRAAVHFELARSVDGWRVVGIQTSDTTMSSLDRLWPPHRVDYDGSPKTQEGSGS